MFIGREHELNTLNKLYNSDKFEFAVIYGRRRVGKTALISEFTKDKDTIFFTGVETNAKQNLDNFSRCIMEYNTGIASGASFNSFQMALEYVFELAKTKRIVLVIDEYPYVARASKSLASTLQLLIDKNKDASKLFLILCGSSMSYMEDHVLAYKAPLYGRRTAQFKINPFEFLEACRYFENFSDEDKALAYGIVGGTPQYLMQLDDKLSIEENIKNTHLNPSSSIFEEPTNLLKHEVREPAIYNAVITAIATGSSKMNEISNKIDEDTSVCATYIKNLITLGIVKKESPYGKKSTRKTIYSIEDNMFHFWYRFVPENTSIISRGAVDLAYSRIAPELSSYMGSVFEDICKQYLWKLLLEGKCAVNFTDLGRWWGANPKTKSQEEIDIMGTDKDTALFAECKWTNEKVDLGVLETLVERSTLFNYKRTHFYLFAKAGFTKGCIDRANEMGNVTLVTYKDMLNA
ncbi:ATP-binding protein [Enterocloster clostridioformis]|uniref:ATP-binding protein n=1 Tax=Enterocloster clostridioformis TaxID=1531 RepID=UPI00232B0013|nr:ATP-binding protein [Enterocloster clostridioformis]MDB2135893.1 ATP-binding protein [Enterocloster clostridioformis]